MLAVDRYKCMTLDEFSMLSSWVNRYHNYSRGTGKKVQTIVPHIDTNTQTIYKITLVLKGNSEDFTTLSKKINEDLYTQVMNWLEDSKNVFVTVK